MSRWDQLNDFCQLEDDCHLIFGINALFGRSNSTCGDEVNCLVDSVDNSCCTAWSGEWNSEQAEELLRYTFSRNHSIYAFEFGNELVGPGGIESHLEAELYADDLCKLKSLIEDVWGDAADKPKIISPDNGFNAEWYQTFIEATFEKGCAPDVVTWHQYILGAGVDEAAETKSMDPEYLDQQKQAGKNVLTTVQDATPEGVSQPEIWMGEAGGAYNSGRPGTTDSFHSSFW